MSKKNEDEYHAFIREMDTVDPRYKDARLLSKYYAILDEYVALINRYGYGELAAHMPRLMTYILAQGHRIRKELSKKDKSLYMKEEATRVCKLTYVPIILDKFKKNKTQVAIRGVTYSRAHVTIPAMKFTADNLGIFKQFIRDCVGEINSYFEVFFPDEVDPVEYLLNSLGCDIILYTPAKRTVLSLTGTELMETVYSKQRLSEEQNDTFIEEINDLEFTPGLTILEEEAAKELVFGIELPSETAAAAATRAEAVAAAASTARAVAAVMENTPEARNARVRAAENAARAAKGRAAPVGAASSSAPSGAAGGPSSGARPPSSAYSSSSSSSGPAASSSASGVAGSTPTISNVDRKLMAGELLTSEEKKVLEADMRESELGGGGKRKRRSTKRRSTKRRSTKRTKKHGKTHRRR